VSCFIYNNETHSTGLVNPFRNIYFTFVLAGARGREIDPVTNQPGQRTAQSVLWHRLSQAPAKPACDRIVREIAKPWHSNSLWVSRQKLASYISAEPAPPAG